MANFSATTESKVSYKLSKVIIQAARSKQSHAPTKSFTRNDSTKSRVEVM